MEIYGIEEKKAIKYLQHLRKYVAGSDEEEFVALALNLIEKQNKELEPIRELGIPVKTAVAELNRLEDLEDDREQMKLIIRDLTRENRMSKELARYLTGLIAKDLEQYRDISSGSCEQIEQHFIDGKYKGIEIYIRDVMSDTRTVSQIIGGSNE